MRQLFSDSDPVTVIGGGVVGLCTCLSLLEAGVPARLLERDAPGQGASHGNAGIISPWSVVPQSLPGMWKQLPGWLLKPDGPASVSPSYALKLLPWAKRFLRQASEDKVRLNSDAMELLTHSSIELYRQHLRGTGHEHLIQDSYYVHAFRAPHRASMEGLAYQLRLEKGAPIEVIGESELRSLEPALSKEYTSAVIIKAQARATSPGVIGEVLAEKMLRMGGEILQTDVHDIKPGNRHRWIIETSHSEINTNTIVVTAGAWSARLLASFGVSIPLAYERGYHIEFAESNVSLNNSVMDVAGAFVASSMDAGLRVAGTAEFAELDAPLNPRRTKSLLRGARRLLPDLRADNFRQWMGVRPSFPDSLPMIGEFSEHPGMFAGFGHCHYGLMMAPRTGQLLAGLITGVPVNCDLSSFDTDRFGPQRQHVL